MNGRLILNSKALKLLRQALHLSQEEMADMCAQQHLQISLSSIKRAETGFPVRYRIARELAQFFQVSVNTLQADNQPAVPAQIQAEPDLYSRASCQKALELIEKALDLSLFPTEQQKLTFLKNELHARLNRA